MTAVVKVGGGPTEEGGILPTEEGFFNNPLRVGLSEKEKPTLKGGS